MFWHKKTDGFEWHKYVRTTIKIRREGRRQKLDGAKGAALDSLKGVGRAGLAGSAAGLDRVNNAIFAPIVWLGRGITSMLDGLSSVMQRPLAPLADLSVRNGVAPMAGLVAAIAGLLGLGRISVEGFDAVALIEIGAALAVLAALLVPPLVTGRGLPALVGLPQRLGEIGLRIPGASLLSPNVLRAVTATVIGGAVIGGGLLAVRAIGLLPVASLSSLPGLSRPALEGRATVLAGDLIRVNSRLVRLSGIEAPEHDQQCGGQGKERRWRCGAAAQTALQEMVRGRTVRCDVAGGSDGGEAPGTCSVDNKDIAAELVSRGHVFAAAGLFSGYGRLEQDARNAKLGLWRGVSERPADYRARLWEVARKTAPDGCPIKGHVSSGARLYVVPWQPSYPRIKVQSERGGRWFCSEQEAQAAGWKPVERS